MEGYTHELFLGGELCWRYREGGRVIYDLGGKEVLSRVYSVKQLEDLGYEVREINFSIENE